MAFLSHNTCESELIESPRRASGSCGVCRGFAIAARGCAAGDDNAACGEGGGAASDECDEISHELAAQLEAMRRQDCYVVDEVLKESSTEITERVHFEGMNGASQGPFVRKRIERSSGLGGAYERIFAAQQAGRRFRYIPRIYDCAIIGDEIVVVMEYVFGETLEDVVRRCEPSMALAADVFPRVCDAVCELHERFDPPIVHRDLKPGNIMLSSESLTIIDFGISRTCMQGAQTDTTHFGTRAYAPPEQFGFAQTTVRSDVYALGLLLYFCLVGNVPDATLRERNFKIDGVPEAMRRVIAKAAAFDPKNRYKGVRELKAAFKLALHEVSFMQTGCMSANGSWDDRAGRNFGPQGGCASAEMATGVSASASGYATGVACGSDAPGANWAPEMHGHSKRTPSQFIPQGLGVAWNVVLTIVYLFFMAIAFTSPFNPGVEGIEGLPMWFVLLEYWFMLGTILTSTAYTLLDRRRLQVRFPVMARLNWWQTILAAAVASLVAIVVTMLVGWQYTQPIAA